MDREGFRNRLKQYKLAREENPGLKYWEWKDIPRYDEGGKVTVPTEEEFLKTKKKNLNDYELKEFDPWIRFFGERDYILDQIRKRTNEDAFTQKRRYDIAEKYTAPFIKDKEIVLTNSGNLTGAKLSENLLDSLYKYSDVVGIPVQDAIGLAAQETTFGKFHGLMNPKDKISVLAATGNPEHGFDPIESLHNHSYEEDAYYDPANEVRRWLSRKYPNIKGNALTELAADELENNPNYYINEGVKRYNAIENPWVHAFNVYKLGKYNSNDKRHTADVLNAGKLVMQDPAIKKWAQEKGIAFAEGGEVKDVGGYTESYWSRKNREAAHKALDPSMRFSPETLMFDNAATGEEDQYWRAYLGLENTVPHMNENAYTEWDKQIEAEKKRNGEPLSDFYGTTPNMDLSLLAVADTLTLGKMSREYDKYSKTYKDLPSEKTIKALYYLAKTVMDNPGLWQQMYSDKNVIKSTSVKDDGETNPLGMLAHYGMKWVPEENALYIHDTYDFPWYARWAGKIKERPKEMKIRSKIGFDPNKGSKLLRSAENYNNAYK